MTEKPRRRSIRLPDYDYTQNGAYFITICTHQRQLLFGEVVDDEMLLSDFGVAVRTCWNQLVNHYDHIILDAFIVMPNHIHGIIVITESTHGLPEIVRALKSFSTRQINSLRQTPGQAVWQRNYWEHIIRNERSLEMIRTYIHYNPAQWTADQYYQV